MSLRLAFMGSPDFAVPALNAVVEAGHTLAAVYAQPPRPAGRGKKDRPTPVHKRALELGLEIRTPVSLRDADAAEAFAALDLDVAVVAAYGLILPRPILDAPKHGCLNIHPSLLPRWRGAAPIQRAVMCGDTETGICIMRMGEGLDTGPVILREQGPIGADETAGVLHDRLAAQGARMLCDALARLEAGNLTLTPQSEDGITYASKIDKAEARIDWTRPATELDAHIRGLSPSPGAWCEITGERVKVLLASATEGSGQAGMALTGTGLIACGTGSLQLQTVQKAGKPAMPIDAFLRGFALPKGINLD